MGLMEDSLQNPASCVFSQLLHHEATSLQISRELGVLLDKADCLLHLRRLALSLYFVCSKRATAQSSQAPRPSRACCAPQLQVQRKYCAAFHDSLFVKCRWALCEVEFELKISPKCVQNAV